MDPRGFRWARLVVVLCGVAALAVAFLPFEVGETDARPRTCYAGLDGWSSGPAKPSNTDLAAVEYHLLHTIPAPGMSRAEQLAYAERERAWLHTPASMRVTRYGAWAEADGACVLHGARDRLVKTGWLTTVSAVGVVALVAWKRTAKTGERAGT